MIRSSFRYALAFYLGATVALLVPFASPAFAPLALGARILELAAGR